MILFADHNIPYPFAVSSVLLIGLLKIFALICGHMLSGVLDIYPGHYDSIATGHISQVLHYLDIGRLSVLIVPCLLTGFFDPIGILLQHAYIMIWQSSLSDLFVVPVNLLFTIIVMHYTGKIVAPWIPCDHNSAITEEEYTGSMTLTADCQVTSDNPCEGKLIDQFSQTHYLLLEPEEEKIFTKGDKVLIVYRLSTTQYLAEDNLWSQILQFISQKEV